MGKKKHLINLSICMLVLRLSYTSTYIVPKLSKKMMEMGMICMVRKCSLLCEQGWVLMQRPPQSRCLSSPIITKYVVCKWLKKRQINCIAVWDHSRPHNTIHDHTRPIKPFQAFVAILDHTRPNKTIKDFQRQCQALQDHIFHKRLRKTIYIRLYKTIQYIIRLTKTMKVHKTR